MRLSACNYRRPTAEDQRVSPAHHHALASVATVLALLAMVIPVASSHAGILDQIRSDTREGAPRQPSPPEERDHHYYDDDDDCHDDGAWTLCGYALMLPFWGPHAALADDFSLDNSFPRFPYDNAPGYSLNDKYRRATPARHWAGRVRFEYADDFQDVSRTSGHMLLTTATRFGLDAETGYLREELAGGGVDDLALGDCNIVFRFAQNEFAQFRAGLGFNWLDDPIETNFGFNFTYGADFFPAKPWIVSSTIDLGTLGDTGLFRYRLTTGVVVNRYEVYAGYEYLDIGSSEINSLVSGVRVWF